MVSVSAVATLVFVTFGVIFKYTVIVPHLTHTVRKSRNVHAVSLVFTVLSVLVLLVAWVVGTMPESEQFAEGAVIVGTACAALSLHAYHADPEARPETLVAPAVIVSAQYAWSQRTMTSAGSVLLGVVSWIIAVAASVAFLRRFFRETRDAYREVRYGRKNRDPRV